MRLDDFRKRPGKPEKAQGDPEVICNALYKTADSFNCYLTPAQAIALSRNLLMKAQLILEEGIEDAAVQMWNPDKNNEKVRCGLVKARKGGRRTKRADAFTIANLPRPRP